jgi:hypothetical protein
LLKSVRGRRQEKVKVLRALVDSGDIDRNGSGKRGDPYCYRLAIASVPDQVPAGATESSAPKTTEIVGEAASSSAAPELSIPQEVYKTYTRPDGTTYSVTKEEFDRTVHRLCLLLAVAKTAADCTPTEKVV